MSKFKNNSAALRLIPIALIIFFNTALANCLAGSNAEDLSFYKPSSDTKPYPASDGQKVKNIIFCIGDGMGAGQVTAARIRAAGVDGKLYMERMPTTGIVRTHSADSLITDSAASGTALACGVKTKNGMIGMTADGKKYKTILEAAGEQGRLTGLVTTTQITNATPAAFAAHIESRQIQDKIAEQLLANRVNVLFGGGKRYFLPATDANSKRKDRKDLIAQAKRAGYTYIQTAEELKSAQGRFLLGLFQTGPLSTQPPEPSLAELTAKAIEILSSNGQGESKGFFLMIEGGQIDWACHDNDLDNTIRQTLLFDLAVKNAVDFALKDGLTLVVVTADHETGGLNIIGGKGKNNLEVCWCTKGHSGLPVPVYALGPKAEIFSGVYDNTEIAEKFAELLDIKPFPKTATQKSATLRKPQFQLCDSLPYR